MQLYMNLTFQSYFKRIAVVTSGVFYARSAFFMGQKSNNNNSETSNPSENIWYFNWELSWINNELTFLGISLERINITHTSKMCGRSLSYIFVGQQILFYGAKEIYRAPSLSVTHKSTKIYYGQTEKIWNNHMLLLVVQNKAFLLQEFYKKKTVMGILEVC